MGCLESPTYIIGWKKAEDLKKNTRKGKSNHSTNNIVVLYDCLQTRQNGGKVTVTWGKGKTGGSAGGRGYRQVSPLRSGGLKVQREGH